MFAQETIIYAFVLTLFAGLATGIGAAFAFFLNRTNTKFLSLSLGVSAGVMLYVSFMEILPESRIILSLNYGEKTGSWLMLAGFFSGILLIGIIDRLVPAYQNPHQLHSIEEISAGINNLPQDERHDFKKLRRVGLMAAISIAIHNFPEGIATFAAALNDPSLGLAIAIAIAIHNIPEGIAVSVPLFYATGNRKKAFLLAFCSGLAEPVGALVAVLFLLPFINSLLFGLIFAAVAGIMVFISLDELLPAAEEYGEQHLCTYGVILGMAIMAISLLLL